MMDVKTRLQRGVRTNTHKVRGERKTTQEAHDRISLICPNQEGIVPLSPWRKDKDGRPARVLSCLSVCQSDTLGWMWVCVRACERERVYRKVRVFLGVCLYVRVCVFALGLCFVFIICWRSGKMSFAVELSSWTTGHESHMNALFMWDGLIKERFEGVGPAAFPRSAR